MAMNRVTKKISYWFNNTVHVNLDPSTSKPFIHIKKRNLKGEKSLSLTPEAFKALVQKQEEILEVVEDLELVNCCDPEVDGINRTHPYKRPDSMIRPVSPPPGTESAKSRPSCSGYTHVENGSKHNIINNNNIVAQNGCVAPTPMTNPNTTQPWNGYTPSEPLPGGNNPQPWNGYTRSEPLQWNVYTTSQPLQWNGYTTSQPLQWNGYTTSQPLQWNGYTTSQPLPRPPNLCSGTDIRPPNL
ncbi:uncharacterized protein LOC124280699 [Haliotis rubra]|uniref:uncharacterized protein LOC124280699 n=1 Tax=Haliotis rubra TaxID=36100 RepID=UPI001EE5C50A|nr:uncharacterized protein LOC124280699 [Haliotis rubra]